MKRIKPLYLALGAGAVVGAGYFLFKPEKAEKPKRKTVPDSGPGSSGGGSGSNGLGGPAGITTPLPVWNEDRVVDTATKLFNKVPQYPTLESSFLLARNTVRMLWPNEPWPAVYADLKNTAPNTPLWVKRAGNRGQALRKTWDAVFQIAQKLFGYPDA
jgi:hypothetical protein